MKYLAEAQQNLVIGCDRRGLATAIGLPFLLGTLASCGADGNNQAHDSSVPDASALRAELEPRYRFYETAFDQKNADAFVADFYADDIVAVSEGQGYTSGKPGMLELVRSLMRDMKRIRVTWHEPHPLGPDTAFDLVQNEVVPEGSTSAVDQYKSMLVWRRIGGVWRVAADFYAVGKYNA